MKHIFTVAAIAALLSSCSNGSHASNPAAPTPTGPTPTASYTLHGVVFADTATGVLPLQGAQVQGPRGSVLTTGTDGSYLLTGLAGPTFINVSRTGYAPFQIRLDVTADMQFDVHMSRAATVSLSGVVFEIVADARVPIEGVEVYCDSCGEDGHTFAYTDASGRYLFPELFGRGYTQLLVRKDGYTVKNAIAVGNLEGAAVMVDDNTQFDIELIRR